MSLSLAAITLDCSDVQAVANFWSAAFGQPLDPQGDTPIEHFASLGRSDLECEAPTMMFVHVPEPKSAKNRMHLDLRSNSRSDEVARLVGLGATIVHDKEEGGVRWTTLADPEGNEFCVASH